MDFDLTDDQVALRDGIRSLCEGRFPIARVREGFDRAVYAELADAGVFSLRADGFGLADAAVVFEELGRAVVPGPLVWLYLANGLVDGVAGGLETHTVTAAVDGRAPRRPRHAPRPRRRRRAVGGRRQDRRRGPGGLAARSADARSIASSSCRRASRSATPRSRPGGGSRARC